MTATCCICIKPVTAPWRIYDERGKVIEGCVSGDHDGQLVTPSESAYWHGRKDAKDIRRAERQGRR